MDDYANPVGRRNLYLAIVAVIVIAASAFQLTRGSTSGPKNPGSAVEASTQADFDYVVEVGTSAKVKAGASLTLTPEILQAKVGQVIQIDIRDDVATDVGPFRVPAKSVLTQKFTKAGTFIGRCVLSPTGSTRIVVTA
jgi:hypothetical protein